jgi:thiol:disulfide interchange protein DsbD
MPEHKVFKRVAILLSVAVVLLLVGLGLWYFYFNQAETGDPVASENGSNTPGLENPGFTGGQSTDTPRADTSSRYVEYQDGFIENLEEGEQAVLFFKANWCSTCNGLDEDIQQNVDQIPQDYYVVAVDFDRELDLIARYEAFVQHTLVLINSDGEMVRKWVGSPTLEELLDQAVPNYENEAWLEQQLNN